MAEQVLRWVSRIPLEQLGDLRPVLAEIDRSPGNNRYLPFAQLPMLHFASLTLFDEREKPDTVPLLVFECNIDRPFKHFVKELVRIGRRGLDTIYSGCADYPGPAAPDDRIVGYLSRRKQCPQLYHIGHPSRSVQEIRGDYELRRSIVNELATNDELKESSPVEIVQKIRVKANCPNRLLPNRRPWHRSWSEAPARPPAPPTPLDQIEWLHDQWHWAWLGRLLALYAIAWTVGFAMVVWFDKFFFPHKVSIGLLILAAFAVVRSSAPDSRILRGAFVSAVLGWLVDLPFKLAVVSALPPWLLMAATVPLAPTLFIVLAYLNIARSLAVTRPRPPLTDPLKERVRKLLDAEDQPQHSIYNHVAGLSRMKGNFLPIRLCRTWLVLQLLNLFYRAQYVKGKLVTIPSIHFAQWSLVGKHDLLFVTNYDGAADSYLDDFFNSLANGVAFIWFDTTLFPRTTDPRCLKAWVRAGQTLASVRYRAPVYDGLTVGMINSNTYIRERLLRGHGQASARRWLARFVTTPAEPTVLSRLTGWVMERTGVAS